MSPRPPAPGSLAPGLPLPRRPAHRRLLAVITLAVLFIAAAAPAVSGEILVDAGSAATNYDLTGVAASQSFPFDRIVVYKIEEWQGLEVVYMKLPISNIYSGHRGFVTNSPSYSKPVSLKVDGEIIGSGTIHYNLMYGALGAVENIQIWVDIDTFNCGSMSGTKTILLIPESGALVGTGTIDIKGNTVVKDSIPIGFANNRNKLISASHIIRSNYYWDSEINSDNTYVLYNRNGNVSTLNIVTDEFTFTDTSSYNLNVPYVGVGMWEVVSPFGKTFTGQLGISDTEPDSGRVTIYVQSSQTGALLAGANLSILASAGGTETEIINTTLPGGTATYTLQPTGGGSPNPDYYRAVATVPGYTQIVENHSFTLTGPHDVIIEMRPDTGGPLDPDRAYLEFYVRDLHANPIASASVQCDGRIKQTNSQGYAVFEVSKNATYPYVAKKSGYVTIEGTATVADGPRYVANVVLGPGTVPTYTPTLGPGETPTAPGATPTPDTRTNEQKGQAIIDLIADFAEPIAILAILATIFGLMKMMTPGRR